MLRHVLCWVGVRGGDVNVREHLRHTRMLRHVLWWVGVGDVNVRVHLRHKRMLRHVLCWAGGKMFWRKQVACCTTARKSDRRKKNPASFEHQNLCKLQAKVLKPLDFVGQKSMIVKMQINSFAMAKTTFFPKR